MWLVGVIRQFETWDHGTTYVTTLEHELGNNTVESRAGVAEALLASAESTEVGGGLGDDVVKELEGDAASGGVWLLAMAQSMRS